MEKQKIKRDEHIANLMSYREESRLPSRPAADQGHAKAQNYLDGI